MVLSETTVVSDSAFNSAARRLLTMAKPSLTKAVDTPKDRFSGFGYGGERRFGLYDRLGLTCASYLEVSYESVDSYESVVGTEGAEEVRGVK